MGERPKKRSAQKKNRAKKGAAIPLQKRRFLFFEILGGVFFSFLQNVVRPCQTGMSVAIFFLPTLKHLCQQTK
jgi:hypothetical protein